MTYTVGEVVRDGPEFYRNIEVVLNNKKISFSFDWHNNAGKEWTFDLLMRHEDLQGGRITHKYYDEHSIGIMFDLLIKHLPDTNFQYIEEVIKELNALIFPYFEAKPPYSAKVDYLSKY